MAKWTERCILYRSIFSIVLLIISLITLGLAWGHWAYTLDTCSGVNCGCILFGELYSNGFAGGNVIFCEYITYAQIPAFVTSVFMVFYYCYRECVKGKRNVRKAARKGNPLLSARKRRKTGGNDVILDTEPPDELDLPSRTFRIVLLVLSILINVLLLSAAIIATIGFYRSCKQYRRYLVRELTLSGNAAEVVGSRMACTSVFDFLDFLQPDRKDFDQPFQYSRKDRINTGITLLIGKGALFMNFINWVNISVFNIKRLWSPGGCCRRESISYQS